MNIRDRKWAHSDNNRVLSVQRNRAASGAGVLGVQKDMLCACKRCKAHAGSSQRTPAAGTELRPIDHERAPGRFKNKDVWQREGDAGSSSLVRHGRLHRVS
jgi:hypothetical protein